MTPQPHPTPEKLHGGGPQTETGKATSSQNALTYGLFATRDFIRPNEDALYDHFAQNLHDQLTPAGILELNLVDEIRRAMWRLRRCSQIEESFSGMSLDPMQQEAEARLQLSVDRARSQSHRLLHKATAELRKLQTERQYRNEYFEAGTDLSHLGVADFPAVIKNIDAMRARDLRNSKLSDEAAVSALFAPPDLRSQVTISTDPHDGALQNVPPDLRSQATISTDPHDGPLQNALPDLRSQATISTDPHDGPLQNALPDLRSQATISTDPHDGPLQNALPDLRSQATISTDPHDGPLQNALPDLRSQATISTDPHDGPLQNALPDLRSQATISTYPHDGPLQNALPDLRSQATISTDPHDGPLQNALPDLRSQATISTYPHDGPLQNALPDLRSQATISTYPHDGPLQNALPGQESSFCKNTGHATSVMSNLAQKAKFVL